MPRRGALSQATGQLLWIKAVVSMMQEKVEHILSQPRHPLTK